MFFGFLSRAWSSASFSDSALWIMNDECWRWKMMGAAWITTNTDDVNSAISTTEQKEQLWWIVFFILVCSLAQPFYEMEIKFANVM